MLLIFISGSCGLCLYHRLLWPIIYHCSRGLKHFNSSHKPAGFFHYAFSWNFNYLLCFVFFSLLVLLLFIFVFNSTLEARLANCPKVEIAPNKAESDNMWRESFLKQKPGTVSDFCWKRTLRRRDLESCSVRKWGQTCFVCTEYQKGFNERYFQPFPGFPHFFSPFAGTSQEQPSQAPAYTARTCSCREEKWGKSLVPPAAAIWKIMYSYEDVGVACHWAVFCHQKRYRNLWLERYNLPAKSCFYQSNEPEEAGN